MARNALTVFHDDGPDEKLFANWEHFFIKKVGPEKEDAVRQIFDLARKGAQVQRDERKAAKLELAGMLRSLADQIGE